VARALGELDIGQAVVIQEGVVLALEGAEHTDALVHRAGGLKKVGPGPILVKMKKPQQDPRFDLPSLGVDTVKEAVAAGFSGIAAEAKASLLIGREEVVRLADSAGLFIVGVE
jgi:UDP-2,3-diacylglucosamine hydrolase